MTADFIQRINEMRKADGSKYNWQELFQYKPVMKNNKIMIWGKDDLKKFEYYFIEAAYRELAYERPWAQVIETMLGEIQQDYVE